MAETEPMLQSTTDRNLLQRESLLLHFNITYKKLIRKVGVSPSGAQILLGYEEFLPEINVPYVTPIGLFNDERLVFEEFSFIFRCLGIDSDSHQQLVSRLIGEVKEGTSCASMEDSNVLPFKVQIIIYSDIREDEPDCVEYVPPSPEHENRADEEYDSDDVGLIEIESSPNFVSIENYESNWLDSVEVESSFSEVEDSDYEEEEVANSLRQEYDLEDSGFIEIELSPNFGSIESYESNWLDSVEVESSFSEVEDSDYEEEDELAYVMGQLINVEYEDGNYGMVPAAVEAVEMLEEVKVEEEEKGETCSVCLEEFDKIALALPCAHTFHENCILRWLSMSHFCPLCRFEMPTT